MTCNLRYPMGLRHRVAPIETYMFKVLLSYTQVYCAGMVAAYHRVVKTHRIPYFHRWFTARELYSSWIFCGKWPARYGILWIFAALHVSFIGRIVVSFIGPWSHGSTSYQVTWSHGFTNYGILWVFAALYVSFIGLNIVSFIGPWSHGRVYRSILHVLWRVTTALFALFQVALPYV